MVETVTQSDRVPCSNFAICNQLAANRELTWQQSVCEEQSMAPQRRQMMGALDSLMAAAEAEAELALGQTKHAARLITSE